MLAHEPANRLITKRLKLRLVGYAAGAFICLGLLIGLPESVPNWIDAAMRALCALLVILTVYESRELSWRYKLWKGARPQLALFVASLAAFALAYLDIITSNWAVLPSALYLGFAAYTSYASLNNKKFYIMYGSIFPERLKHIDQ